MQRYPYANIWEIEDPKIEKEVIKINRGMTYDKGGGKFQGVIGGVPNVPVDLHGNLAPMDNRVVGSPGNTIYKIKCGQGKTFLQDRATNKYLTRLETFTGESLEITMPNLPAATPVILSDGVSMRWVFPQGHKITQYVTEKHLKEIVFQKKNVPILFQYKPTGLDVTQKQYTLEFYSKKTGKLVYKTERPYYVENGDMKYVDIQIQKVNSNWHITYLGYNKDREIDPTIVFGEGGGVQIGGDHKDTYITLSGLGQANGGSALLIVRGGNNTITLMRFSLSGHIPINATIVSSVLTLTKQDAIAPNNPFNLEFRPLNTNWGVTNIDEGGGENPATGGQATYRRSFDFNGAGGDITWVGGNYSAADRQASEGDTIANDSDAVGTIYNAPIPIMTQAWVNNDAENIGFAVEASVGGFFFILHSQEAVVPANRPYLTVNYTIPSARRNLQSKISIHSGIGIR